MQPFPISMDLPVSWPGPAPAKADVVVVGGGVIGVCAALFLARRGQSVVLLEKGRVAGEQSSRNWGWIRQQGRDPDELPIVIEACALWKQLARECGEDFGLADGGVAYLAKTRREMDGYEQWMVHARAHGVDTRLLDTAALAHMLQTNGATYCGALETPSDMRAEPWKAVPALARLAAREGVAIVENCAVRRIDVANGQVCGVVTEAGRIEAAEIVVACGAWSSLLLRQNGVSIPQLAVRATAVATEPLDEIYAGAAADDQIAFRRRQDGGYTLAATEPADHFIGPDSFRNLLRYRKAWWANPSATRLRAGAPEGFPDAWRTPRRWSEEETPFERMRILDPAPDPNAVQQVAAGFGALFPRLAPIRVRTAWAGMIDTMPDVVPIIDRCRQIPGLTIATGMSGHGFGIGPGVGRVLADLVTGSSPGHDLSRFRLERFTDGSPIRLGPAL